MDSTNAAGVLELSLALSLSLRSLRLRVAPGSCWHHDVRHYLTVSSTDKSAALPSWSQLSRDQCVYACVFVWKQVSPCDRPLHVLLSCSWTPTIMSEIQGWKLTLVLLCHTTNEPLHLTCCETHIWTGYSMSHHNHNHIIPSPIQNAEGKDRRISVFLSLNS